MLILDEARSPIDMSPKRIPNIERETPYSPINTAGEDETYANVTNDPPIVTIDAARKS
jgi:hypothetical protein